MIFNFEGKSPEIGTGSYISDSARIIGDVLVGDNCYVGHGAVLRGDLGRIMVENNCSIEEGVIIHAPPEGICRIGESVTLNHGAIIHAQRIGNYAVIGMGAILGLFSQIGKWTIVAEGGIVRMRQIVPENLVIAGNPAQAIREISESDKELRLKEKTLYSELARKYLNGKMKRIS